MRIGIDFDNTIACYDGVFHAAALERGLIPADLGRDKNSVRDHLNGSGRKDDFTELQGYVYGARMELVSPYPGFAEFVGVAQGAGHELFIVSHKTRHPILGPKHDMHAAARGFLAERGLVGDGASQIDPAKVFFELTKEDKVARAASLRCDVFIDDLPEILAMPGFPDGMRKILFDPENQFAGSPMARESLTATRPGPRSRRIWPVNELNRRPTRACCARKPPDGARRPGARARVDAPCRRQEQPGLPRRNRCRHAAGSEALFQRSARPARPAWRRMGFSEACLVARHSRRSRAAGQRCRGAGRALWICAGRKLLASELTPAHIDAAIDFVLAVNARPRRAAGAGLGSLLHACRTYRHGGAPRRAPRHARSRRAACPGGTILCLTQAVAGLDRGQIAADRGRARRGPCDRPARCAPTNAACRPRISAFTTRWSTTTGNVTFLDFEYAGRDDPAKLVSDFFCQPEIPVPLIIMPTS